MPDVIQFPFLSANTEMEMFSAKTEQTLTDCLFECECSTHYSSRVVLEDCLFEQLYSSLTTRA